MSEGATELDERTEAEKAGVVFTVTSAVHGHAHVEYTGTHTGAATFELVAKPTITPSSAVAGPWAADGRWGCIVHLD